MMDSGVARPARGRRCEFAAWLRGRSRKSHGRIPERQHCHPWLPKLSTDGARVRVTLCYNTGIASQLPMSTIHRPNRFRTGVSLDPEISAYLDDLALRMGTNRSWVLNTIVYEYAKF